MGEAGKETAVKVTHPQQPLDVLLGLPRRRRELLGAWAARGRHLVLGASPVPVSRPGAGLAAGLGILAELHVEPAGLRLHPGLHLLLLLRRCG